MSKVPQLKAVLPGASIAVVSLASSIAPDRVHRGVAALRALGFDPVLAEHALAKTALYFAGTPEQRLTDLHRTFADDAINAAICTRGGYGTNYLLPALDLDLIQEHPKPLIGYSDNTAIQTWLLDQAGLQTFHGPMLAADFSREEGVHLASFLAALTGEPYVLDGSTGLRTLQPGHASGVLYGGCLSILAASLGTPYAPRTEGKLLFLEDVGAKPYQVDRMLRQLILAGKLEGVCGIIFGEMLDCVQPGAAPGLFTDVIAQVLADFRGPIAFGLRSGHVSHGNVTLTFGIEAELEAGADAVLRISGRDNATRSDSK